MVIYNIVVVIIIVYREYIGDKMVSGSNLHADKL